MASARARKSAAARALPGVLSVWTGEDTADIPPVDFRDPSAQALLPYRQPVLAAPRCVRGHAHVRILVLPSGPDRCDDASESGVPGVMYNPRYLEVLGSADTA